MAYSSAQISGLVGGQMAMFSNQAAFSQQIGGAYGTGPQMPPPSMQNPFPSPPSNYGLPTEYTDYAKHNGAGLVGTIGHSLPAAAGAMSFAAGFANGPMRFLDPTQGVATAFRAGVGLPSGAGFGGTVGAIGEAFASRGLGAGLGMLGRGALMGGLAAAPYMAAGAAIQYVGGQIYEGAQNINEVGKIMGQYSSPSFGPGSRVGGGQSRGAIQGLVSTMHELMGEDSVTTMDSLKRLLDMAGRMGMAQGTTASQFKDRFSAMVKQVREIAKVMGTTMEEAAPLFGQMRQMGLWTTKDILGASQAMHAVGAQAAPHLMGAMQAGSQMSYQMGGPLAAGANMGRNAFMQVQAAMRRGTISEAQLSEFTGGVGGVEGQRMMSEQLTGVMSRMTETPMGRLMMAGLGEYKDGKFTGGINAKMMERFNRGEVSVDELQRIGMGRTSSREGATSWEVRKGQIGQQMMASGGLTAVAASIEKVLERSGHSNDSDDIKNMLIQKMTGLQAREAEFLRKMVDDLPNIVAEQNRTAKAAMEDSFRKLDIRKNRSWEGIKEAVGHRVHEAVGRPMQEAAGKLTTSIGRQMDDMTDWVFRVKRDGGPVSTATEARYLSMPAKNAASTADRVADMGTPWVERLREGRSREETASIAIGGSANFSVLDMGSRAGKRAAAGGDLAALGYSSEKAGQAKAAAARVLSKYLAEDPAYAKELKSKYGADAVGMAAALYEKVSSQDKAEIAKLARGAGGTGPTKELFLDLLSAAQKDEYLQGAGLKIDVERYADQVGFAGAVSGTEDERAKIASNLASMVSGTDAGSVASAGATYYGLSLLGPLGMVAAGAMGMGAVRSNAFASVKQEDMQALLKSGVSPGDLTKFMNGEMPESMSSALKSQSEPVRRAAEALRTSRDSKSKDQREAFLKEVSRYDANLGESVRSQYAAERKKEASEELAGVGELKMSAGTKSKYSKMLESYSKGDLNEGDKAISALMLEASNDPKMLQELRRAGGGGTRAALGAAAMGLSAHGEMTKKQFNAYAKKTGLSNLIAALPEVGSEGALGRKDVEKMLSDGKLGYKELMSMERGLKKAALAAKTGGSGGAGAADDPQTKYIQANTIFVQAVQEFANTHSTDKLKKAANDMQPPDTGRKPTE